MSEISRGHKENPNDNQHVNKLSRRRRQLFPSEENLDSDLGKISSINALNDEQLLGIKSYTNHLIVDKYADDFSSDEENYISLTQSTPTQNVYTESMSPLYLSPNITYNLRTRNVVNELDTPGKHLSTVHHRTPQDSSSLNGKLPKLTKKSLDDELWNLNKTPSTSDECETLSHNKGSKVRTALFPEVPAKNFYPKIETLKGFKLANILNKSIPSKFVNKKLNLSRKYNYKKNKRYGQINAGVRHFIKRPKKNKLDKDAILKVAEDILDNSPLNQFLGTLNEKKITEVKKYQDKIVDSLEFKDYLNELQNLNMPVPKLIKNNKNSENISVMMEKQDTNVLIERQDTNVLRENRKRSCSPILSNQIQKKFFKSDRPKLSYFKDNNVNVKASVKNGNKNKPQFEITVNNSLVNSEEIDNLIEMLDENDEIESTTSSQSSQTTCSNTTILTAHNSIIASDNSIQLHENITLLSQHENLLMSPTSVMCNMASGLALNSPQKNRDLSSLINSIPDASELSVNVLNELPCSDMEQKKLFPVFDLQNKTTDKKRKCIEGHSTDTVKKMKKISQDQMLLDAGQKRFGVSQCNECKLVYHVGDPSDEVIHSNFHSSTNILRFNGWKNERVLAILPNEGRIINILPNDPITWLKKIHDVLEIINNELGFYDMQVKINDCQVFIYIKKRTIVGCLVAEPRETAFRLLSSNTEIDFCSESVYAVKCGVSRIWVSPVHRKTGIGSAMMNCLKKNFLRGDILNDDDIAFSSPTEMGKKFAINYFKTPNFLIYM